MESMVDVVVAKYMRPPQATEFMEYLLRLALYDLEEVWADECAGMRARVWTLEGVQEENIRLKAQMKDQEAAVKKAKTRDDLLRLYNTEAQ